MASRADGAVIPAPTMGVNRGIWGGFLPLLLLYYAFMPVGDVLAGALETFYEIDGFAVAYKAGTILLLILFLAAGKVRTNYALVALGVVALLVVGAGMRQSLGLGGFKDDLLFIARSPILLSSAVIVLMSLHLSDLRKIASTYFVMTWTVMSSSILVTTWLGISLTTYDAGYGSRGFYQAANEVTLGYVLCWWYLVTRITNNNFYRSILTIITLYVMYTVGTKSGFVLMPILLCWVLFRKLNFSARTSLIAFVAISYVVVIYSGQIFLAVLPYLPAANSFTFFIDTYGVETALTGGRFYQLDEIIGIISQFNWMEIIFGIGFQNFWFAIDGTSVESDLIDIFGGGGIIFVSWFYGMLAWGYMLSKTRDARGVLIDTEWSIVFIAVVMYSIFVGHVAFAATPLITTAMFLALAYKERMREDRDRSILV